MIKDSQNSSQLIFYDNQTINSTFVNYKKKKTVQVIQFFE